MQNTMIETASDWPRCDEDIASTWDTIEFPVHFHVIHDGERGKVPARKIEDQLDILNAAFAAGRIGFREASLGYHDHKAWFRLALGSDEELAAKRALRKDTKYALNFYVANLRRTGANGYAQQPWEFEHFPDLDGVVVHHEYLPGGPAPRQLGGLGVHGVGHWLGLHHTFEGHGSGGGDRVPDTPDDQNVPTPCKKENGKNGAARNYMDRVCDLSPNAFTLGQVCRIRNVVLPKYKPWLLADR